MRCDDPDFQLPRLLVRREVISESDGAKLRTAMERSGGPLENSAQFSAEELRNFGRLQATEILIDALTWESGQFRWTDDQTMPAGLGLFELELEGAEEEAARRSAEAAVSMTPAADVRFKVAPQSIPPSVTLSAEELRLLLAIGQGRAFGELVTGDGHETSRLVHRLRVRGLIEETSDPLEETSRDGAAGERPEPEPGISHESSPAEVASEPGEEGPVVAPQEGGHPAEVPVAETVFRPLDPTARDLPVESVVPGGTASDAELPFAILTLDDDAKTSYPLLEDQMTIGRSDGNSVRIVHGSISGRHARVDRTPAGYRLEDLKSRNGTFVNGNRVEDGVLLNNDDRVRLGTVYMTFSMAAEVEPKATVNMDQTSLNKKSTTP